MTTELHSPQVPEPLHKSEGSDDADLAVVRKSWGERYAKHIDTFRRKAKYTVFSVLLASALSACGAAQDTKDAAPVETISATPTSQAFATESPAGNEIAEATATQAVATEAVATESPTSVPTEVPTESPTAEAEATDTNTPAPEVLVESKPYSTTGEWSTDGEWAQLIAEFDKISPESIEDLIVAQGFGRAPEGTSGAQAERSAKQAAEIGAKFKIAQHMYGPPGGLLMHAQTLASVFNEATGEAYAIVGAPEQQ